MTSGSPWFEGGASLRPAGPRAMSAACTGVVVGSAAQSRHRSTQRACPARRVSRWAFMRSATSKRIASISASLMLRAPFSRPMREAISGASSTIAGRLPDARSAANPSE